jgi:hypothetical protein
MGLAPVLIPKMLRKPLIAIVAAEGPFELKDQREILLQAAHFR